MFLLGGIMPSLYASHLMGGEIRYQYAGTSNGNALYHISVKVYRDCSGVSLPSSAMVNLNSANGSTSLNLTLPLKSIDDAAPACSFPNRCTSPSALLPGFQVGTYEGTVVFPSTQSDWVISYSAGARTSMNNLSTAGSMYLEATLDNTNGVNSNSYTGPMPAFFISPSSTVVPLQTIDPDGDSIVFERIAPLQAPSTPVSYAPGYSATNPFTSSGTYTINQGNQTMTLQSSTVGKYALAYRIKEYRNGTMIGSHIREFATSVLQSTGGARTFPMLAATSKMEITVCQNDRIDTAYFTMTDPSGTDSVFTVTDTTGVPQTGWTYGGYNLAGAPSGYGSVIVEAPVTVNPNNTPFFFITARAYDDECPRNSVDYAILVRVKFSCLTAADTVWPGDANSDNVVSLLDPLAIALTYNQTGPTRPNASIVWMGQEMTANWGSNVIGTSVDKKHADCNGDGTVNLSDLSAVVANYGLTHPKEGPRNKTTGAPELSFDLSNITFSPGATVDVPVMLGDAGSPMNDFYGVATRVAINFANSSLATQATINTSNSWLGSSSNTLTFNKDINNSTIDFAHARIDQQNTSGNGQIATLSFTVPANAQIGERIDLTYSMATLIDKDGKVISNVNINDAVAYVNFPVSVAGVSNAVNGMAIVPNPSGNTAVLQINAAAAQNINVAITDVTGKVVWTANQAVDAGSNEIVLPASQLTSGIYMINVDGNNTINKTLKWVKH